MRRSYLRPVMAIISLTVLTLSSFSGAAFSSGSSTTYLVLVWYESGSFLDAGNLTKIPFLRLYSLECYYPIAILLEKYGIKATLAIPPSVLESLERISSGSLLDENYFLAEKLASGSALSQKEKYLLISSPWGVFGPLAKEIYEKWPRYYSLYLKFEKLEKKVGGLPEEEKEKIISSSFSDQELLDLCSMFNLYWIPKDLIANNSLLEKLWEYGKYPEGSPQYKPFSEEDLSMILKEEMRIIKSLIPLYKSLLKENLVEFLPSSYSDAILPLLYDLGWKRDLNYQIELGISETDKILGGNSSGFWMPSMAVNPGVLEGLAKEGISWTIISSKGLGVDTNKPWYFSYENKKIFLLIEDWNIQNYFLNQLSKLPPKLAAEKAIEEIENCSKGGLLTLALPASFLKYYSWNSTEFLQYFYSGIKRLEASGKIVITTPSEYLFKLNGAKIAEEMPKIYGASRLNLVNVNLSKISYYNALPVSTNVSFPEYSMYGDLSSWIGNSTQNRAWELLKELKEKVTQNPSSDAYLDVLKAEGQSYFYYFGKAEESPWAPYFDQAWKKLLIDAYQKIGVNGPDVIYANCYPNGMPYYLASPKVMSERIQFVEVDGNLSEWRYYYLYSSNNVSLYISSDTFNLNFGVVSNQMPSYIFIESCWYSPNATFHPYGIDARMGVEAAVDLEKKELVIWKSGGSPSYYEVEVAHSGNVTEVKVPMSLLGYIGPLKIYVEVYFNSSKELFPYSGVAWYIIPIKIQKSVVAYFIDPAGDDKGPGTYVYPDNPEIPRGVFDLLIFKVEASEGYVIFNLTFRTLGGNPLGGPNGFSFQMIQIYVQVVQGMGPSEALPGPNVRFKDFTWDFVVQATGWPSYSYIRYYNGVEIHDLVITAKGRSILIYIPSYEIGHPQKSWEYVVLVGGFLKNSTSTNYWMPVKPKAGKWNFGGGDPKACEEGIAPRVIDVLDPGNQYSELSSYNTTSKTLAEVSGLSFPEHMITPTLTPSPSPSPSPGTSTGSISEYAGAIIAIVLGGSIMAYILYRRRR